MQSYFLSQVAKLGESFFGCFCFLVAFFLLKSLPQEIYKVINYFTQNKRRNYI